MHRRALAAAAAATLALAAARAARADGEITLRGAYYKERSTKVQQPMIDARLDVGPGELNAHVLVDAITSASVASGAEGEAFTEVRYEHAASYLHRSGWFRLGGGYRFSDEPDYRSLFFTVQGQAELAERNTVLGVALADGSDEISNGTVSGLQTLQADLDTDLVSASVTQVLSPVMVAGVTYDLVMLDGYLANPYRTVSAVNDSGEAQKFDERVPGSRTRHALFGSVRRFVPETGSTVFVGYRYYQDDWGIVAHTPEVRFHQDILRDASVRLRYRYYEQTAAEFYRDRYDAPQQYLTDDPKLDAFRTQTFGVQLASELGLFGVGGKLAGVRVELLAEYVTQTSRFGDAVIGQLAISLPLEY
jgi:hypothetical protein